MTEAVDVLLVEDAEATLRLVRMIVEAQGHSLHAVTSGSDAVECLTRDQIRPRLVLLDIQLPHVSGLDVVGSIRRQPHLRKLPVVALSAHVMTGDVERFMAAGCNDYVPKPIDTRSLAELVTRYLGDDNTAREGTS